jgi:GT2 family glycosyltransferase
VDVVSGATLVLELETAIRLGGLDESFFHYAEEVDYCLRVRRTGGRILWSCSTVVPHAVGGSMAHTSASAHYYTARNKLLLARKHDVPLLAPRLVKDQMVFAARAFRDRQLRAWATGALDGVRGIKGVRAS